MKFSNGILLVSLLISCFLASPAATVQASPQSDPVPNPETESYVLNELRASGYADLQGFAEEDRVISGDFLVTALKDSQVQSQSFIFLGNAIVADGVIANDMILPGNIQFSNVEFRDFVDFDSSLLHAFWINDSSFLGSADFSLATFDGNIIIISNNTFDDLMFARTTVNGSMDRRDNTFNLGVNFYGTHITGELLLDGSKFLGTGPLPGSSFPVEFWTTTVDRVASFANTHFAGEAYFAHSDFYRLDVGGAAFDQNAYFTGTSVERAANFTNARFGQLADLKDFPVRNTATFEGTIFTGRFLAT